VEGDRYIFCSITKVCDAYILLARHRCYHRDYPMDWTIRHLKLLGLNIVETRTNSILYNHGTIVRQVNIGCSKLMKFFQMKGMAREMGQHPGWSGEREFGGNKEAEGREDSSGF